MVFLLIYESMETKNEILFHWDKFCKINMEIPVLFFFNLEWGKFF